MRRQHRVARGHGAAVRRHRARRHHDLDDDQLAGADAVRDVSRRSPKSRERTGGRCRARSRTTSSRNSSRRRSTSIRRAQSMRLITDIFAFCAKEVPRWNTVSVSGYHIREAGSTVAPGTGLHPARRHRVHPVRHRRRARRRRLRPADFVLLQFAQRLLRGDREVPRRPEDLGRGDARPVRREGRAVVEAAVPHPDRRRLADRAAALQQRRPDGAAGARGGARRHQLAAHELARRGARAADGGGGDVGAADAADHRARKRRHRTSSIRSAARSSSSA